MAEMTLEPRVLTRAQAASYCGLTPDAFTTWIGAGRLPRAMPGTRRWDRRALDAALDRMSGLSPTDPRNSKDSAD